MEQIVAIAYLTVLMILATPIFRRRQGCNKWIQWVESSGGRASG